MQEWKLAWSARRKTNSAMLQPASSVSHVLSYHWNILSSIRCAIGIVFIESQEAVKVIADLRVLTTTSKFMAKYPLPNPYASLRRFCLDVAGSEACHWYPYAKRTEKAFGRFGCSFAQHQRDNETHRLPASQSNWPTTFIRSLYFKSENLRVKWPLFYPETWTSEHNNQPSGPLHQGHDKHWLQRNLYVGRLQYKRVSHIPFHWYMLMES